MSAKIPPKPGKEVIYIDVDDEITSIIDKVENSKEKVVALVLPKRATSLQSIVNMKLLKRSADQADKSPVLITSEAALMPLAGAAGLHVAKNLQSAPEIPSPPAGATLPKTDGADDETPNTDDPVDEEDLPGKIDYASGSVGALAAVHEAEHPETIDLDDEEPADEPKPKAAKAPKDKKNKVPNFDRFKMMMGLGILALVAVIVFIVLALFVLPKATVTLTTASEPVSANFKLNASTGTQSIDTQKGVIPAKVETTDQTASQSVTATGQQNNGQTAAATITLSIPCADVTSYPEEIPQGTGITSSNGLSYTTQKTVDLTQPGGGGGCSFAGSAPIAAIAPGSKYNSPSSPYTIARYPNVSGSGFQLTTQGTDNIVTVLSQSDVDNVTQKLTSGSNGSDFAKQFEDKLAGQGEYVFVSTLKTGSPNINASPAVGQPASTANVSVKITYTVLTVQKSDLSQAIEDKLAGQIDKTKQKLSGNFLGDADITANQTSANSAELTVNENTTAVPIINIASVRQLAAGKKTGDIQAALNGWAGVKSVKVDLSPFWVSKAPGKTSKIKVVLIEAKSNSNSSAQQ